MIARIASLSVLGWVQEKTSCEIRILEYGAGHPSWVTMAENGILSEERANDLTPQAMLAPKWMVSRICETPSGETPVKLQWNSIRWNSIRWNSRIGETPSAWKNGLKTSKAACQGQNSILDPQTLNPKPLNPKPLNPKPSILDPQTLSFPKPTLTHESLRESNGEKLTFSLTAALF
jgi:hypothetical protein